MVNSINTYQENELSEIHKRRAYRLLANTNQAGVFCLLSPSAHRGTFERYGKNIPALLRYTNNTRNWYLGINTWLHWSRKSQDVCALNGFYADLDVAKSGLNLEGFEAEIPKILKLAGLPQGTWLQFSGHGFYLIWLFDKSAVVHSKWILEDWSEVEKEIVKRINKICQKMFNAKPADQSATDVSRVLRVAETNNVKREPWIKSEILSVSGKRYSFTNFWLRRYLLPLRHRQMAKAKSVSRYQITFPKKTSLQGMKWHRVNWLMNWLRSQHYSIDSSIQGNGKRHEFLVILASQLIDLGPSEEVVREICKVNDELTNPLNDTEITKLIREIRTPDDYVHKYHYRTSTIMKELGIQDRPSKTERRREAKLRHAKHWKRRNRKIMQLSNKGLSVRKISAIIGLGKSRVSKVINQDK